MTTEELLEQKSLIEETEKTKPFRKRMSFGKRVEYDVIGKMLMEGLDCYIPLIDDHGVDCVIKKSDGTFVEIQIKARSEEATENEAALFAPIYHSLTDNFYFIFYSDKLKAMWIMSSKEFIENCSTNAMGRNEGAHSIRLNRTINGKACCDERYNEYLSTNFSRLH